LNTQLRLAAIALTVVQLLTAPLLLAQDAQIEAPKSIGWLHLLAKTNWQGVGSDSLRFPPDERLWLIIGFKTCCLANQIAVNWVVKQVEERDGSFQALGLSMDPSRQAGRTQSWLKSRNVNFPYTIPSSDDLRAAIGFQTAPALVLFNGAGVELYRTMFFTKSDAEKMEQLIASYYSTKDAK